MNFWTNGKMIAKVSIGRSFGGCLTYLFEGHKGTEQGAKQAEVLASYGVRIESVAMMTTDFNRGRLQNADLGRAVWHTALAFHPEDAAKIDNARIEEIARGYMARMSMDAERDQWVLIRHHDTQHSHAHLVVNRVQPGGSTVSDQFSHERSKQAAESLSKTYGLTVASEKGKDLKLTNRQALPGHDQARYAIFAAITEALPGAGSFQELGARLADQGIRLRTQEGKGNVQGVVFELAGHHLKGSQIDRRYSAGNLLKAFQDQRGI